MKPATSLTLSAFLCTTMLALAACGAKPFVPGTNVQHLDSAGFHNIPAQVDIVLGVDTVGNIANMYGSISPDFVSFVNGLEASKLDYRFIVLPITTVNTGNSNPVSASNNFAVSHYDGYWNAFGSWLPRFPNDLPGPPSLFGSAISSAMFPSNYNGSSGVEPGIESQLSFVQNNAANFLRAGATLAVMTLSSGRDTSGASWVPANQALYNQQIGNGQAYTGTYSPVNETPIATLRNGFVAAKGGDPSKFKYYSLVSNVPQNTSCNGFNAWPGTRYAQMAQATGGMNLDLCSSSLPSMLNAVKSDLASIPQPYRLLNAVLNNEPKPETLRMTANIAGSATSFNEIDSSNTNPIPAVVCNVTNGFHYIGNQTTAIPTIEYLPNNAPLSLRTGYMVQLCGTARISGNDTADISYENAGSQTSQ